MIYDELYTSPVLDDEDVEDEVSEPKDDEDDDEEEAE